VRAAREDPGFSHEEIPGWNKPSGSWDELRDATDLCNTAGRLNMVEL